MNPYSFDEFLHQLAENYPAYFDLKEPDMKMNDTKLVEILRDRFPTIVDMNLTNPYSHHDFEVPEYKIGGEIKVRRTHYEPELGIDKTKYDYLMTFENPVYVVWTPGWKEGHKKYNGYPEPQLYMWNLRHFEEPFWYQRLSPTSTDYAHHQQINEIKKYVGYLDIRHAEDLSRLLYFRN